MSERGAFTTEYLYCDKCFAAAKKVLLDQDKYLSSVVPTLNGKPLPIVAGKIGGMCSGEELFEMEYKLIPRLESLICHEMRIAVLAEAGQNIFTVKPKKEPHESP